MESVVIGSLEFTRDGHEMFVNKLVEPGNPDGDGEHVATAEGIWDDVWDAFVNAAKTGDVRQGTSS